MIRTVLRSGFTQLALLLLVTAHVDAQRLLPPNTGMIDRIANVSAVPNNSFFFIEESLGRVGLYPSQTQTLGETKSGTVVILGAAVPTVENLALRFTIFMAMEEETSASAVEEWSSAKLLANTPDKEELQELISGLKRDISLSIAKREQLEAQIDPLRKTVSTIGRVDEIVAMQLELSSLQQTINDRKAMAEELSELLSEGRSRRDPKKIDVTRKIISEHLRQAAQVTSVADRLDRRRRSASEQKFKQKLQAVREMKNADLTAMAQQALSLQKKRRALEASIRPRTGKIDTDQF